MAFGGDDQIVPGVRDPDDGRWHAWSRGREAEAGGFWTAHHRLISNPFDRVPKLQLLVPYKCVHTSCQYGVLINKTHATAILTPTPLVRALPGKSM